MEGSLIIIGLGLCVLVLYFLPTLQAFTKGRRHPNATAIFALNLLLGWTVIGWVAALIWSLAKPSPSSATVNNSSAVDEITPTAQRSPCPYCAELILPAASICRFCSRELPQGWAREVAAEEKPPQGRGPFGVGSRVMHTLRGTGEVTAIDGEVVTVKFREYGTSNHLRRDLKPLPEN